MGLGPAAQLELRQTQEAAHLWVQASAAKVGTDTAAATDTAATQEER